METFGCLEIHVGHPISQSSIGISRTWINICLVWGLGSKKPLRERLKFDLWPAGSLWLHPRVSTRQLLTITSRSGDWAPCSLMETQWQSPLHLDLGAAPAAASCLALSRGKQVPASPVFQITTDFEGCSSASPSPQPIAAAWLSSTLHDLTNYEPKYMHYQISLQHLSPPQTLCGDFVLFPLSSAKPH